MEAVDWFSMAAAGLCGIILGIFLMPACFMWYRIDTNFVPNEIWNMAAIFFGLLGFAVSLLFPATVIGCTILLVLLATTMCLS